MAPSPPRDNADQTITLLHVREIHRYNDWVFSHLAPHVRGRVLEMGCGIGTYSVRLRPLASRLVCVDMNPSYVQTVRGLLGSSPEISVATGVLGEDLNFPAGSFDTIVCLNVIEHIHDDAGAASQLARWLAPGGTLLVQVPAHQWLYGSMDAALGHFRRYTSGSLRALLEGSGLQLLSPPRYLFALGVPGWWWFGRVQRRTSVPEQSVAISNLLAGLSRRLESAIPLPLGLTLIARARRRSSPG